MFLVGFLKNWVDLNFIPIVTFPMAKTKNEHNDSFQEDKSWSKLSIGTLIFGPTVISKKQ